MTNIGSNYKRKTDLTAYPVNLPYITAVYYFVKGFTDSCNNFSICEEIGIKVDDVMGYLGYKRILVKYFGSLDKFEEFVDDNDEDGVYEFYENLGKEYAREILFINYGKLIYNIKRKRKYIIKAISEFLDSKLGWSLFPNGYNERKNMKNLYIV